mgnify:CR=1 FL=1
MMKTTAAVFAAATVGLLAMCSPAMAHIVLQVEDAQVGAAYRAVLVVGHGCGDEATTGMRVQVPEGFYNEVHVVIHTISLNPEVDADIAAMRAAIAAGGSSAHDLNRDLVVNLRDLLILRRLIAGVR